MATEDGYFIGRRLAGVDLTDFGAVAQALQEFEEPRRPHTARQSHTAYYLGQVFHHAPRLLDTLRDLIPDHTPLLQKVIGASDRHSVVSGKSSAVRVELGVPGTIQ